MMDSNQTGSVLFRNEGTEAPPQQEVSAVPLDHAEPSIASSDVQVEKGGSPAMWAALLALAVALVAQAGYDYWYLRKTGYSLATIPNLVQSMKALGGRVDGIEAQVKDWATERQALLDRMTQTDERVQSELGGIRSETRHLVATAEGRLQAQIAQSTRPIETRLDGVAANQQLDHARLAQLSAAVGTLRQRVAAVQHQQAQSARQLGTLESRESRTRSAVDTLAQQLQRKQLSFEAGKGRDAEIAPGISLHVTHTNVLHQRYSAWIRDVHTHQTLWVNNQGIEQPVIFFSAGERPMELIVTRVSKQTASGYLLVPETTEGAAIRPVTSSASNQSQSRS